MGWYKKKRFGREGEGLTLKMQNVCVDTEMLRERGTFSQGPQSLLSWEEKTKR